MGASPLALAKSIYCLFNHAVYFFLLIFYVFLNFRADSFVRSLLAVF